MAYDCSGQPFQSVEKMYKHEQILYFDQNNMDADVDLNNADDLSK